MKNIFITGATSFIGVHLIKELIKGDYNIFAITRNNSSNIKNLPASEKIKILQLDMEEIEKLPNLVNEECDIFIHLAWNGTRGKTRDNKEIQDVNYKYSMIALKVAKELGCKTFIGAGSQAEYGLYNCEVSESTKCKPVTEYGKAKLKLSIDGFKYCNENNINFKWPRFFSLYGIDDYEGTMLISAIDNMLQGKEVLLTKCIQMWNFLYIKDAVKGIIGLMEKECPNGIYNFGSDDTRQLKLFIEELLRIIKSKSKVIYGAIPYPETGMVSVQPNINKLKEALDWVPEYSFEKGIEEVILSRKKKLGVK